MTKRRAILYLGAGGLLAAGGVAALADRLLPRKGRPAAVSPGTRATALHPSRVAHLEIERHSGVWLALLTLTNSSVTDSAYLDPYGVPRGVHRAPPLQLRDAEGEEIVPVWPCAKHDPPGPDEYVALSVGASERYSIELSSAYELPRWSTITIWYDEWHGRPDSSAQGAVLSNTVDFDA